MVCRNPQYAEEARSELVEETGNENIHVHILDLSKPKDVITFARKFSEQEEKLDVLVNNAGKGSSWFIHLFYLLAMGWLGVTECVEIEEKHSHTHHTHTYTQTKQTNKTCF